MPFIPVPNTVQLELVCTLEGQRCETVLHYTKASPWSVTQMTEAAAFATSLWDTYIKPHVTTTLALVEVAVVNLESQFAGAITYGTGLPITGTVATGALPNNVALCITKRTGLRGRAYRGRLYHYPLTEAQVTGNVVLAAAAANYVAAWKQFLSLTITDDEPLMVVVSRQLNNVPRTEGVATLVTDMTTDGLVDSQRRRLPGRGQ